MEQISLCGAKFRGVEFDAATETMAVIYKDGRVFRYSPIPIGCWHAISCSPNRSIVEGLISETYLRQPVSVDEI
jgi:hypothetical protein